MCGILGGVIGSERRGVFESIQRSLNEMHERGPNDRGHSIETIDGVNVFLGHTRLSIIDLSIDGRQPMVSHNKRFRIVFNGEIYNYRELRTELSSLGVVFYTESDTEVLLAAWAHWGEECLKKLDGMFAFCILDTEKGQVICVRDAFGIKPLFYSFGEHGFCFASTIKALQALRREPTRINRSIGYQYLVHGDIDSSRETFVSGIYQLRPGELLRFDVTGIPSAEASPKHVERWWVPKLAINSDISFEDAAELVRSKFLNGVKRQLRSDVALGAALSGGVDSSAVVCAMRHLEPEMPIHTFSYIAEDPAFSEESWVDLINLYVGATSHKVLSSGADLVLDLDDMIDAQGEPFGSTSIYAQYRVFQHARENGITVTLDGQGADELLAGYTGYPGFRQLSLLEERRYFDALAFISEWAKWPARSHALAIAELGRLVLPESLYALMRRISGRDFRPAWLNLDELHLDGFVCLGEHRPTFQDNWRSRRVSERLFSSLTGRGLPALLRYGDRNSMNFSVESRVPFLTVDLAETLLSLPEHYLISKNGETKSVFRAAMRGIVPDRILDRRDKVGFATPEEQWTIDLARSMRETIFERAREIPILNHTNFCAAYDKMLKGEVKFSWQLWRWINYVTWHSRVISTG